MEFAVQDVQQISPEWSFARTNSAGKVLIHATGETSAEANQELFVCKTSRVIGRLPAVAFPPQTRLAASQRGPVSMMQAVVIREAGGPEVLKVESVPVLSPKLVRC